MSYNPTLYARGNPNNVSPAHPQRNQPQAQRGIQPQPFYSQPQNVHYVYNPAMQGFPVIGYPQQQGTPIYVQDESFAQIQQIPNQPVQQQIRYTQPVTDGRRKKKDHQSTPTPTPLIQQGKKSTQQTKQQAIPQPTIQMAQNPAMMMMQNQQPTGMTDSGVVRPALSIGEGNLMSGCFNIIRRGNIPGITFTQAFIV